MAKYTPVVFSPGNPVTAADLNILKDNIENVRAETQGLTSQITTATGTITTVQNRFKAGQNFIKDLIPSTPKTGTPIYYGTNFPVGSSVYVILSIFGEIKKDETINISVVDSNNSYFTVQAKSNLKRETLNFNWIAIAQVATS